MAFTDDRAGARLPPEDGPWQHRRAVDSDLDGWTSVVDRSAADAGIAVNGYFLFESDSEPTFGEEPTEAKDFP
jgi:hypothetical protein